MSPLIRLVRDLLSVFRSDQIVSQFREPEIPLTCIHATTIAWRGQGALILGASGSGKSRLALHLMAHGCDLVADDRTELCTRNNGLIARCPTAIQGKIEARGFGILSATASESAQICCAVDLDKIEKSRLPEIHSTEYLGISIRLFHNPGIEVLPFALLQYLKSEAMRN